MDLDFVTLSVPNRLFVIDVKGIFIWKQKIVYLFIYYNGYTFIGNTAT